MKNKLKEFRSEKRWSQSHLAGLVNVSRNSIISIENGRFDPSLPLAFDLADAFGVRIEDIFEHEKAKAAQD